MPLIVAGPGIEAGSSSDVPVTLQDLFATVSELAGVTAPLDSDVESAGLVPILQNGEALPEGVDSLTRLTGPAASCIFTTRITFQKRRLAIENRRQRFETATSN